MRFKLRSLLILLALLPPLLWIGWGKYQAWRAEQERQRVLTEIERLLGADVDEVRPLIQSTETLNPSDLMIGAPASGTESVTSP